MPFMANWEKRRKKGSPFFLVGGRKKKTTREKKKEVVRTAILYLEFCPGGGKGGNRKNSSEALPTPLKKGGNLSKETREGGSKTLRCGCYSSRTRRQKKEEKEYMHYNYFRFNKKGGGDETLTTGEEDIVNLRIVV